MYLQTLAPATAKLVKRLEGATWLDSFYLAGGTALALQYGHRQSVDLDFFSTANFTTKQLLDRITTIGDLTLLNEEEDTVEGILEEVKVSFMTYQYPLLLPTIEFAPYISLAAPLDIALMKLSAIAGRNTRKDFIDLYFFLNNEKVLLSDLIKLMKEKYPGISYDEYHLYKSLCYFADADREPMPNMLTELDWKVVKKFFQGEVKKMMR